jgi:hypothetical protein
MMHSTKELERMAKEQEVARKLKTERISGFVTGLREWMVSKDMTVSDAVATFLAFQREFDARLDSFTKPVMDANKSKTLKDFYADETDASAA